VVAQGVHVILLREIRHEYGCTRLGRERLEPVRPASDTHNVPAVRAEQPNRRRANP
jgi:hypothetical protein